MPLQHAGLALASAIAALVNAGLLFTLLLRLKIFKLHSGWLGFLVRCGIANMLLALLIYFLNAKLAKWFAWHWQQRFFHLLLIVIVGIIFYCLILLLLGLKRFNRY